MIVACIVVIGSLALLCAALTLAALSEGDAGISACFALLAALLFVVTGWLIDKDNAATEQRMAPVREKFLKDCGDAKLSPFVCQLLWEKK